MDLGSPHVFGELCVCPGGLHVVGGGGLLYLAVSECIQESVCI